jgi:photosystem II stability/assembly factor-like uncharacterized protein
MREDGKYDFIGNETSTESDADIQNVDAELIKSKQPRPANTGSSAEFVSIELVESDPAPSDFFSGPIPRTKEILEDAALRDVCQVGAFCCAVGDRGVICLSSDGGESWTTKATPFECQLRSVCFLTNRVGWIGGLRSHRGTSELSAVILETRDGGGTWKRLTGSGSAASSAGSLLITASTLPGIMHLEYFGLDEAIAVTLPSDRLGGHGIFRSSDGGMTWTALPTDQPADRWVSADFLSVSEGIVGGSRESLATVVADQAIMMNQPRKSLRAIRGASLDDSSLGWVVGDGASILRTDDAGVTWRAPDDTLPEGFSNVVDLRTVSHRENIVLAAGAPGSFVLRSEDDGGTWDMVALPANGMIHKIRLTTDQTAIAVGSFGQILHSADGGSSWECVRSARKRTGVLNLVSNSTDVAWSLLARVTADEGVRSAVVQISQPLDDSFNPPHRQWSQHASVAITGLGICDGTGDWMFARTKPELDRTSSALLKEWDRQTDGRLRELLPLRLARELRIWRPSVVIVESSDHPDTNEDAVASVIRDALPRAIELAQQPEHVLFDELQLQAWTVQRVVARTGQGVASALTFAEDDLLPHLRTSNGLMTDAARSKLTLSTGLDSFAASSHYEISFDQSSLTAAKSLFDGMMKSLDSTSRRPIDAVGAEVQKQMQQIVTAARVEASSLVGNTQLGGGDGSLIAHMTSIGDSLPATLAIRQLSELGQLNLQQNNMDGYLAVQQEILRRFPESPAARSAAEVLLLFYSSAETRRFRLQGELGTPKNNQTSAETTGTAPPQLAGALSSESANQLDALNERWDQHAATAFRLLASTTASVENSESDVQNAVPTSLPAEAMLRQAANLRNQARPGEHSAMLAEISRMPDPFGRYARAEMQITHAAAIPELPTFNIPRRKERPFLDGRLTDSMWESSEEIRLSSISNSTASSDAAPTNRDNADLSSLVMIGSDDEHLYVAGVFELSELLSRRIALATHRSHDAAHELRDRFELEIDTDRDYSTAFHFCIDESGLTSDRCWILDRWNPSWFVDVKRDERSWRFEAAIPLRELAIQQPRLGSVWGIRLRRIQPGSHAYELTTGSGSPTQGAGLIRFIRPKVTTPGSGKR